MYKKEIEDLHTAIKQEDLLSIILLLEKYGEWVKEEHLPYIFSCTVLMEICSRNMPEALRKAISLGIPVDRKDNRGRTALMFATVSGQIRNMEILIDAGANLNAQTNNERENSLHKAIEKNLIIPARFLIEAGIDIHQKDIRKCTPAYLAALRGMDDLVIELIERGSDKHAVDEDNCSLLHASTVRGGTKCVSYLIESGININAVDFEGDTALHYAISSEKYDNAEILVKHGIDINIRNDRGRTALDNLPLDRKSASVPLYELLKNK